MFVTINEIRFTKKYISLTPDDLRLRLKEKEL